MSVWDGIKKILLTIAPAAASIIGTPAAGVAVAAIGRVLLGKDDAKPEELLTALQNATPEQILQLKQADFELAKLNVQETQNARDRELSFMKILGSRDWTMTYLVGFVTVMWGSLVFLNMYIPDGTEEAARHSLDTILNIMIGYYFSNAIQNRK